jgi:DNA polymerase elongation subunit (family B)
LYIDAVEDRKRGEIRVVERRNGKRYFADYPADYSFYVKATEGRGKFTSIYGDKLEKITPSSFEDFMKLKNAYGTTFESDGNKIFRTLESQYEGTPAPLPHVAFFDIEVDFDKTFGYSTPDDALNKITSISVYLDWLDQMICVAVPPKTLTVEEATVIADEVGNTLIVATEHELLQLFLTIVEDADILSGWNSDSYDIPYTLNRIAKVLGKQHLRDCCLWDIEPIKKTGTWGGREYNTYLLRGRVHLDYLQLYKKFTYEERPSFTLDSIAEYELGERKVPYEGNLDQLYNNDFKKFLEYNIQDTMILGKLDKKLKFLDLLVTIAHENSVTLDTAMGTVAMMDQVITKESHRRGMIAPDSSRTRAAMKEEKISDKAAGGWVAYRNPGLHKWVGSSDLASLYPSVIRALNMSPETLVGQVTTKYTDAEVTHYVETHTGQDAFAKWWNDRFSTLEMEYFFDEDTSMTFDVEFVDGMTKEMTGAQIRKFVFHDNTNLCITANGTIFRTDVEGIIPGLLTRWYKARQELQRIKGHFGTILDGKCPCPYAITNEDLTRKNDLYDFRLDDLMMALETEDEGSISKFFIEWGLTVVNNKIVPNKASQYTWKVAYAYWDKQQLVKKISLNSAYGGLLNKYMKFYDKRIGQSTTLTGRQITRHMTAKTNELLTGKYDHDGKCIIYNDTDSTYFSAWPEIKDAVENGELDWNKDIAIALYDQIGDEVSDTFPQFMLDTFNVPLETGKAINSKREIVAETGLFIKKKRYACLVYDKEGSRKDVNGSTGQIKAMGLDLRRSDTPPFIQDFLSEVLLDVLNGIEEFQVVEKITEFRKECHSLSPWKKGSPKAVNGLTDYIEKEEQFVVDRIEGRKAKKPSLPGHVRASKNWNLLRDQNNDKHTMPILDGQKVVVCDLKKGNANNMKSVAYPVDELHLPQWFTELPFDEDGMVTKILDKKLKNLLGVLKWDIAPKKTENTTFDTFFKW